MSSRLPIGVGQTISRPGGHGPPLRETVERDRRSADHPGLDPEACGHDPHRVAQDRQHAAGELGPRRLEQQLAGRDHAAADHDDLRVEDVDQAGDRDPEPRTDQLDRLDRGRVAVVRELGDQRPGKLAPVSERQRARVGALGSDPRGLARERRARRERFDAAPVGAVALAGRPMEVDHDVSELARGADRSPVGLGRPRIRPPPIPVPIVISSDLGGTRARRRRGARRSPRRCRRCRRTQAARAARSSRPRMRCRPVGC